jgi:hypothetical protein
MNAERPPPALLGRRLPPQFERRTTMLAPQGSRPYDEAAWRDALVVVAQGQVELEGLDGSRHRFGRGAILWLEGLPLRAIHNPGRAPALLVAIARRAARDGPP